MRGLVVGIVLIVGNCGWAAAAELWQDAGSNVGSSEASLPGSETAARASRFMRGRTVAGVTEVDSLSKGRPSPKLANDDEAQDRVSVAVSATVSAAEAMVAARAQHVAMVVAQQSLRSESLGTQGLESLSLTPRVSTLNASWQAVGPGSVVTAAYGKVSGRVTAVAIDPADSTGNTVYVGTTGGGVWKSVNAAGSAASVSFVPLTDTLPVFSANAGTAAIPSLSIGALSIGGGVMLAGTGDPNDAADSYYGSGVLRSADGGATWTLVQGSRDGVAGNHSFVGLGFAGFAWSTTVPGLVVAAVSQAAEGTLVNAVDITNSVMGLYYSTDSGVTWQMSVVMDGSQAVQTPLPTGGNHGGNAATAVVWNPVRKRFFAALRYHGYYESLDGATWTRVAVQPGTGLSLTACPTNPGSAASAACPMFRGTLAVEAVSGDTFALSVDRNNLDQGLWQDVCSANSSGCAAGAAFATRLGGTGLEVGGGSTAIFQGDYNLALAAIRAPGAGGETLIYVGTIDLFRCSLAAGPASCMLRNTTNSANGCGASSKVAPAQHAIAVMQTSGNVLLFAGNDGGLWRSADGIKQTGSACSADDATHFDNLNAGLGSLAEVVSFAQHPSNAGTLLVGLGANGTAGTGVAGTGLAWDQLSAGEGGTVAIDSSNPLNWYVSTRAGVNIKICGKGTACAAADFAGTATIGSAQVSGDVSLIDAAWMLDPLAPAELLVGTCRVWRGPAADGAQWSSTNALSKIFGGPQGTACGVNGNANPVVRSLAAGGPVSSATSAQNSGAQVLYAGMAGALDGGGVFGGHVFATAAGGTAGPNTAWTDVSLGAVSNDVASAGRFNPGGFDISSLAVDSHDATGRTVYATVMGFAGNGTNAPHLYRSVDGGGHWANISSNLPNAPANSVVVDPNDANTVYLALDTGVYVTTQVANCATTNCWSVFGLSLPNAPVIQLQVATGMPTGDGRTGELRAGTYGRGIWQIPMLTAAASAAASMSVIPGILVFAIQQMGTLSASQTVTVTNTGSASLLVSQVSATGDFHSTDTCVGTALAAGVSCVVTVTFLPSAIGARTGVLTVYGNVAGGQATVSLAGTAGAASAIMLNPVTITFPATIVGATGAAQFITISNLGGVTAGIASVSVTGDYVLTANTCGAALASQVGCTVGIAFRPNASGVRNGALTVVDDAGTQTALLSGSGNAPPTDGLSPLSLSFALQQVGTASAVQQVTLTNAGDVALTLIAAQVTAGDFTVANGCGNSLNAHAACSMSVAFVPRSVGLMNGVLTVSDQFRSQAVQLNGTGLAPPGVSLTPAGLSFGAIGAGLRSATQSVTLTNNGGFPLTITGLAIMGDFALVAGEGSCGSVLAVGAACALPIVFVPTAGGARSGTVTVTDNAPGSPQVVALSGTGVDFTLAANGSSSVTVASGKTAVFPMLLSSAAGTPGTVVFTCTGAPVNTTCVVDPGSVALGGTTTVSVTLSTGVTGKFLLWLMPLAFFFRRVRRMPVVLGLCVLVGCGSGRKIPDASAAPVGGGLVTPSGTYALVVSGSSAGLVRVVNLTVVVQ